LNFKTFLEVAYYAKSLKYIYNQDLQNIFTVSNMVNNSVQGKTTYDAMQYYVLCKCIFLLAINEHKSQSDMQNHKKLCTPVHCFLNRKESCWDMHVSYKSLRDVL
jgi:hypothetical protein